MLGTGDDLKKLIELFPARRISLALFEDGHEPAQIGDLVRLIPHVPAEEADENDKEDRERYFVAMREGTNGTPGRPGEKHGKDKEDDKSEPPEFALPLFELLKAGSDGGTLVSVLRGAAGAPGGAVVFFEHESGRDPAEPGVIPRSAPS